MRRILRCADAGQLWRTSLRVARRSRPGCFLMLDDIRRRLIISLGYCSLADIAPEVCYKQFYTMLRL